MPTLLSGSHIVVTGDESPYHLLIFVFTFRCDGPTIFHICISAMDVFLSDDEWHEPVASEVGGVGAHACQLTFFADALVYGVDGRKLSSRRSGHQ